MMSCPSSTDSTLGGPRPRTLGFTLMELIVVIALISIIMAVAMPQLLPVIAFSSHEGAARRIAGFGRSAISEAALMHDRMTIWVNLDEPQEYWCERWPEAVEGEGEEEGMGAEEEEPLGRMELYILAQSAMARDKDDFDTDFEADSELVDKQSAAMSRQFERMARRALVARAERVVHDRESLFEDVNIFEDPFTLEVEEKEPEPEEVLDPLLQRTRLPQGIFIGSLRVGEEEHFSGLVEIDVTPLGLEEPVVFLIQSDDGDSFIVEWDPITGGTRLKAVG